MLITFPRDEHFLFTMKQKIVAIKKFSYNNYNIERILYQTLACLIRAERVSDRAMRESAANDPARAKGEPYCAGKNYHGSA